MNPKTIFIGAVDLGTSKMTVLVAKLIRRELTIIGVGQSLSRGMKNGRVVNSKAASKCAHTAINQAERDAGKRIDFAYLGLTGGHLEGLCSEAAVKVKAPDGRVRQADVRDVCALASTAKLRAGWRLVQLVWQPFQLDGRLVSGRPNNFVGTKLAAGFWLVLGEWRKVANTIRSVRSFNREVRETVVSSLAVGNFLTTPDERRRGVLVIDIGAGTTDFVLYRNGVACRTGVLASGGADMTTDLRLGLRIAAGQAEKLKLQYGRADLRTKKRLKRVWLDGKKAPGTRWFPQKAIEQITAARTRELLRSVKQELGDAFSAAACPAGLVLTGGTAKLPGLVGVAAEIFGVQANLGEAPIWVGKTLRDPGYHTALGLLYFGANRQLNKRP